jgi:hypothetical protein
MAEYRKQHLLPCLSLKCFVDPSGHVWTYDKQTNKSWHRIPEETGVISHFYSSTMPDGTLDTSIERTLNKIEDAAGEPYRKLVAGERLSEHQRFAFAHFLGAMYVRTEAMRRIAAHSQASDLHDYLVRSTTEAGFEQRLRRVFGREVEASLRDRIRDGVKDLSGYEITIPKENTFGVLAGGDLLAEVFMKMGWTTVTAEHHYFITCDNPIHRATDPQRGHAFYRDHGFLDTTAQVTFPMSPRKLLLMTHNQLAPPSITLPRALVILENFKRAHDAEKQVYAHLSDKRIGRLVAEFKDECPSLQIERIDGAKGFGKVRVTRKSPRSTSPERA